MTAYNDEQAMDDFFNQMNSRSPSYWFISNHNLSSQNKKNFESQDPSPTITLDLHGKTAYQAERECHDILHFASSHHHGVIKIIHGVGTGILRQTTIDCIKKHPDVLLATNKTHNRLSKSAIWIWLKKSFR